MKSALIGLAAFFALTTGAAHAATYGFEGEPVALGSLESDGSAFGWSAPTRKETPFAEIATPATTTQGLTATSPSSPLPDPSVWAMLIVGFGGAGVMMRRQRREMTYRLEEHGPEGRILTEDFAAPDDDAAYCRAASVVTGEFKLWRGDVLIRG